MGILFALLLAGVSPSAPPNPASPDQRALLALERRWLDAASHRDRRALSEILAPGFLDAAPSGKLRTREEALAGSNAPPGATQALEDLRVRLFGDTGIVNGDVVVTAADRSWSRRILFTDVFVKSRGTWRAVSAQEALVPPERTRTP